MDFFLNFSRRSHEQGASKRENDRRDERNDRDRHRNDQSGSRRREDPPKHRESSDKHSSSSHSDGKQAARHSFNSNRHNNNEDTNRTKAPVSNSTIAQRQAEAISRTLERRAQEKVQQLQKLGIEIPTIMQQQQQLLLESQSQSSQIKPLMSMNTSGLNMQVNATNLTTAEQTDSSDTNLNVNLTNFTSSVLTNAKYTEQMQKKKLIWGSKKAATTNIDTTNNKWESAKFSQDQDGKVASKFLRLMGMKNVPTSAGETSGDDHPDSANEVDATIKKREQMFSSMEHQYEVARQATHTMRGMGFGFGNKF